MMAWNLQYSRYKVIRVVLPSQLLLFPDHVHPRNRAGHVGFRHRDILRAFQQDCLRRRRQLFHIHVRFRGYYAVLPAHPSSQAFFGLHPSFVGCLVLATLPHRRHPSLDHGKCKTHTMRHACAHLVFCGYSKDRFRGDNSWWSGGCDVDVRVYTVYHHDSQDLNQ